MKTYISTTRMGITSIGLAAALAGTTAMADVQHLDDVIITFSACIGNDCVNGESFGFDTLRLKENNLRIHFQDTSNSASFPTNDWRIVINDSANGGANYFGVEDSNAGRIPFRVEAGAPVNALYVEDDGDIGIGTATPVVQLHIKDGNTPTVRLEQDGSNGFTPQTWDMAGNEANFFIRDASNSSTLPFRLFPGAPSDALAIEATGDIGVGTASPTASLHVRRSTGTAKMLIEEASGTTAGRTMLTLANNGGSFIRMENSATGGRWVVAHENGGNNDFLINKDGGGSELILDGAGNLAISGAITTTGGTCGTGCDAVFGADYDLLTIAEYGQQMWENHYLPNVGPTVENAPINLSDKLGRMLNALEHAHIYIGQQDAELQSAEQRISTLESRLEALESNLN